MQDIIRLKGTAYEVGYELGRRTAEEIAFVYDLIVPDLVENTFGGDLERFRAARSVYRREIENTSAHAMDVLRGMAFGCGRSFDDMLSIVLCEELSSGPPTERCSTLCVWTADGWVVGHWEDYLKVFYGRMLVYDIEIHGYPRVISLNYAGYLPHSGGGPWLNEAGNGCVNNSLWCAIRRGRSKQVNLFEAGLQTDLGGVVRELVQGPVALTDHYFVFSRGETLVSIEVTSPENVADSACESLRYYAPKDVYATHTNCVERLSLIEPDPAPAGSHMRKWRLQAIADHQRPVSFDEMQGVLMRNDGILRRDDNHNLTLQPNSVTLGGTLLAPRRNEVRFIRYSKDGAPRIDICRF